MLGRAAAVALVVLQMGIEINQCIARGPEFPKIPGELIHFDVDEAVPPTKNAYFHRTRTSGSIPRQGQRKTVVCAPEIFQREMERILAGTEGVVVYINRIDPRVKLVGTEEKNESGAKKVERK